MKIKLTLVLFLVSCSTVFAQNEKQWAVILLNKQLQSVVNRQYQKSDLSSKSKVVKSLAYYDAEQAEDKISYLFEYDFLGKTLFQTTFNPANITGIEEPVLISDNVYSFQVNIKEGHIKRVIKNSDDRNATTNQLTIYFYKDAENTFPNLKITLLELKKLFAKAK